MLGTLSVIYFKTVQSPSPLFPSLSCLSEFPSESHLQTLLLESLTKFHHVETNDITA